MYDKQTAKLIRWSERMGAWISLEDWTEGKDTFPGYEAPMLEPDWERGPAFRKLVKAQWGMVPDWAKDASFGRKNAYNARAETLLDKPTFRTAFRRRRCIVPATAFYERANGRWVRFSPVADVLPIAGLYEPPNRHCPLPTFAMVTTEPNDLVSDVQDRMPVVLSPEDVERWLDPDAGVGELRTLLTPCPPDWLTVEDAGPIARSQAVATPSLFDDL